MLCQQRPRKRRKKHNRRNIFRMILGLVLISVISICAIRLFYRSRSSPPSDSDSDYIIMAADQNGNVSDTPIENSTDADLLQTLQTLKKQEPKIQDIIDHFQEYPSELLEMLSKNLDMLDFVLEYPNKKGEVFSDTIGDVKLGTYPLLLQYDPRWGYAFYGDDVIAVNGCGRSYLPVYGNCWSNRQKHHYPLYNSQLCHAARVLCPRFGHQLVSDERWCIPFRHYRRRINPLSIRNGKRPVIWTANHLQYASR